MALTLTQEDLDAIAAALWTADVRVLTDAQVSTLSSASITQVVSALGTAHGAGPWGLTGEQSAALIEIQSRVNAIAALLGITT